MQTFEEKVEAATQAALMALGLSAENYPGVADALNSAISNIAEGFVTSDYDDDDD